MMVPFSSCQDCSPAEDLHPSQGEPPHSAHRVSRTHRLSVWYLASWNIRTLLDVEGPIETARQRGEMDVVDERKIDQVVYELDRYKVVVATLQETWWFGNGVYKVRESVVLAADREVSQEGSVRWRGEGNAIVLSGPALSPLLPVVLVSFIVISLVFLPFSAYHLTLTML